ncbi:putative MFS family arabinose efflux permease [Pseudonocardia sediminis]|uniref:Putative MFS family arabinose efflux permease n=1 Tax=Pseudonocardia sediminis TaxID=1397368 RepID=A0A4Q7V595_PSEST|nr:MFS transporter [Pseudonocardia sediminis]RZT87819.1 putative MFS family arabinose efflux permease [Pseudonocardia sediminis]
MNERLSTVTGGLGRHADVRSEGPDPLRAVVGLASVGVALIAVCYGLARFAYGLFVPTFRAEFGLDAATAGAVASGSYVGYCVAIVVATVATARWGPRVVAVLAGACATAGTAMIAVAPGALVLACGVVLAGSSTGLASPPLAQAVAQAVRPGLQPRVQSVVNAGTGLGVLISGPVALILAGHWRWAWAAFAAAALAVTVWSRVTVPGGVPRTRPAASSPATASPAASFTAGPSTGTTAGGVRRWAPPGSARLVLAAAVMGMGSAAVWTFGRDLVATAGASELTGTVMWIALGGAGLLGAFAGDLTDRIGHSVSWILLMLLLAVATTGLALAPGDPVVAVAAAAAFGAVYIALTGLLLLWGTRVHADRPVVGVGAAFLLLAAGQALGAPLLGVLADAVTTRGAFVGAALLLVLGAAVRPRRAHR